MINKLLQNKDEHPEIRKARLALEEVNKRIRAYEEEKFRLTEEANKGEGVKALGAKNMLAQIDSSPLKEELNKVNFILFYFLVSIIIPFLYVSDANNVVRL